MDLISKPVNMDANNILTANLLDIIFEGKNKDYGAYELRKTYNKRISISLVITLGVMSLLLIASAVANNYSSKKVIDIKGDGAILQPTEIVEPPPPPPPPPLKPPPPVRTVAYFPPVIHKNIDVITPPPDIREILDSRIDSKTVDGTGDIGYIAPPLNVTGTQVIVKPDKNRHEDPEKFTPIEIDAKFPGGAAGWSKYIQREIEKNIDEFTEADFGTCVVHFIVDRTGKVSQVEATSMKGTKLAEIAVNAIRKGPDWIPAQQNGRFITAERFQPVVFKNLN